MSLHRSFQSWLAPWFERFVTLKRAGGADYVTQKRILLAFDRYLEATQPRGSLTREVVRRYLDSPTRTPRAKDNIISVLWQALGYSIRHDAPIEALGERPPRAPQHWRQRQPRLVCRGEVEALMHAARRMTPLDTLRPASMATLIGLLYTTGMRIGEALALNIGHLEHQHGMLTVVRGKFGKSRELPLHDSTVDALRRYIDEPRRQVPTRDSDPLFVSNLHRRLSQPQAGSNWTEACRKADLSKPWPRPHDLRHTFAVDRVASWYAEGQQVDALLPVLSTYLGHSSVEFTRVYLTQNGALLEHAAARFADQTSLLDEVAT